MATSAAARCGPCAHVVEVLRSDLAICIRTALIENGVAHVQAGAGLVADSVASSEDAEARTKASAVLRAIATANGLSS